LFQQVILLQIFILNVDVYMLMCFNLLN